MSMPEMQAQYICDPEKNVTCKKTNCHLNGGPCTLTCNIEYAKVPVTKVRLVIPMEKTDAVQFGLIEEKMEDDNVRE